MIEQQIINYKSYGECIKISNGIIETVVTVDIGPRIVFFGFIGKENIMNDQKEAFTPMNNELFDKHFYKGAEFNNYGGHRLWTSPEKMPNTYYPDKNPVEYVLTSDGVILTPPEQVENGIQMQIEIKMYEDTPKMDVLHNRQTSIFLYKNILTIRKLTI